MILKVVNIYFTSFGKSDYNCESAYIPAETTENNAVFFLFLFLFLALFLLALGG